MSLLQIFHVQRRLQKLQKNRLIPLPYAAYFRPVTTDQEFRETYSAHLSDFGLLHQKAFETFSRYYSRLANPSPDKTSIPESSMETTKKNLCRRYYEGLSFPWNAIQ